MLRHSLEMALHHYHVQLRRIGVMLHQSAFALVMIVFQTYVLLQYVKVTCAKKVAQAFLLTYINGNTMLNTMYNLPLRIFAV